MSWYNPPKWTTHRIWTSLTLALAMGVVLVVTQLTQAQPRWATAALLYAGGFSSSMLWFWFQWKSDDKLYARVDQLKEKMRSARADFYHNKN